MKTGLRPEAFNQYLFLKSAWSKKVSGLHLTCCFMWHALLELINNHWGWQRATRPPQAFKKLALKTRHGVNQCKSSLSSPIIIWRLVHQSVVVGQSVSQSVSQSGSNHLSVCHWNALSFTKTKELFPPLATLFWKLPPPPCAVSMLILPIHPYTNNQSQSTICYQPMPVCMAHLPHFQLSLALLAAISHPATWGLGETQKPARARSATMEDSRFTHKVSRCHEMLSLLRLLQCSDNRSSLYTTSVYV